MENHADLDDRVANGARALALNAVTDSPEETAAQPGRIVCPACGSEQEIPTRRAKRCIICGKPLSEVHAAVPAPPPESTAARPTNLVEAAAELTKQEPRRGPIREILELLAIDKRVTSVLAFLPLWGIWRISRSDQHTTNEKILLSVASLGVTAIFTLAIWTAVPSEAERAREVHKKIDAQILGLADLVREYQRDHGELPDESVWQRSANGADLRFYDPWGRVYHYRRGADGFTIGTWGRDGTIGGEWEDADVSADFSAPPIAPTPAPTRRPTPAPTPEPTVQPSGPPAAEPSSP
jgi:hypothetical protein